MADEVNNQNNGRKPWKWTDDIIAVIVVGAWVVGKFISVEIPDWAVAAALGYVFGKNIPQITP